MSKTDILSSRILFCFVMGVFPEMIIHFFNEGDIVSYLYLLSVTAYFIFELGIVYFGIKLLKILPGKFPIKPVLLGLLFLTSAGAADIGATLYCSPNLDREGNSLILMLLSKNVSLNFIYAFMILHDLFNYMVRLVLWACLFKYYPSLINVIPYKNIWTTFKWVLGIGKMPQSKNIFTYQGELLSIVSWIAFLDMSYYLYRFYMALMWFGKVPFSYHVVPYIILFTSFTGLTCFTHYKVRQRHSRESVWQLKVDSSREKNVAI